jgi:uncharacterized protein YjbI with pentapeptide repeats
MVEEQADSVTAAKPASNVSIVNFNVADFNLADFNLADFEVADFSVARRAGARSRRKNPWFDTATCQIFFVYSRL